jgi:hypothetical protein
MNIYMPDDLAGKEVAQNMSLVKISRQIYLISLML